MARKDKKTEDKKARKAPAPRSRKEDKPSRRRKQSTDPTLNLNPALFVDVEGAGTAAPVSDGSKERIGEPWVDPGTVGIVEQEVASPSVLNKFLARANGVPTVEEPTVTAPVFNGQHCPLCGTQVKKSGTTGRLYCPKQYAKQGTPCRWPGTTQLPEIPLCTTLSAENQAIIEVAGARIANSLLVRARAGTGKSFQLKQLVRSWTHPSGAGGLRQNPPQPEMVTQTPRRVLLLAFARRDQAALSGGVMGHADVRTGNSAAYWTLASYYRQAGGSGDLNTEDSWLGEVLESMLREEGLIPPPGERGQRKIGRDTQIAIQVCVDKARSTLPLSANPIPGENTFIEPTGEMWLTLADDWDLEITSGEQNLFLDYCERLFEQMASLKNLLAWGKTDFTGQVFLTVYHQLRVPKVYDVVCIDECQDTGIYLRKLAQMFTAPKGHLVAVGDDMQTIYTWRTGEEDGLASIADELARRNGKFPDERPLTVCRRCSKAVIRDAQTLVPDIQPMPEAPEGFSHHVKDSSKLVGMLRDGWRIPDKNSIDGSKDERIPGRQGLVLCRMNGPLVAMCLSLWREGVPAVLAKGDLSGQLLGLVDKLSGGNDNCKLEDFLEFLRTWETDSLRKLGIGVEADDGSTTSSNTRPEEEEAPPPTKEEIKKKRKATVVSDKAECLRAVASKDGTRTVADLKRTMAQLFPPRGEEPDAERTVVLSTVHGAKGGEARYVYLLSPPARAKARDGKEPVSLFDSIWSSERDRSCTLYVAITRSQYGLCYVGPKPTLGRLHSQYEVGEED